MTKLLHSCTWFFRNTIPQRCLKKSGPPQTIKKNKDVLDPSGLARDIRLMICSTDCEKYPCQWLILTKLGPEVLGTRFLCIYISFRWTKYSNTRSHKGQIISLKFQNQCKLIYSLTWQSYCKKIMLEKIYTSFLHPFNQLSTCHGDKLGFR